MILIVDFAISSSLRSNSFSAFETANCVLKSCVLVILSRFDFDFGRLTKVNALAMLRDLMSGFIRFVVGKCRKEKATL